jgi:A/G-specific adenine glycosylase
MALSDTEKTNKAQPRRYAEEKIRRKLRRWFDQNGRDLPWRDTQDPYAVMVSEFMLQQTTVAAVIPYFRRWMTRFPTLASLARATEEEVFAMWQGLGYYRRARCLQRAARMIIERGDREVPSSREELRRLPGVGAYTAAAIATFAFDAREPVVDANIARVLARWRNWRKPLDDARGRTFLRDVACELLPKESCRWHTSALMDLGALICVARKPRCHQCPIRSDCLASSPDRLPVKQVRRRIERVAENRAFVLEQGKLWLELSDGPRWRGLWLLPEARLNLRADYTEAYFITRFRVTLGVCVEPRQANHLKPFLPHALPPMPSPHRRAVAAMLAKVDTAT